MSSELSTTQRRPGAVTFIGVIIQGVVAIVAAAAVIIFNNGERVWGATNQTSSTLIRAGVGKAIVGVLFLAVCVGSRAEARFLDSSLRCVKVSVWPLPHGSSLRTTPADT